MNSILRASPEAGCPSAPHGPDLDVPADCQPRPSGPRNDGQPLSGRHPYETQGESKVAVVQISLSASPRLASPRLAVWSFRAPFFVIPSAAEESDTPIPTTTLSIAFPDLRTPSSPTPIGDPGGRGYPLVMSSSSEAKDLQHTGQPPRRGRSRTALGTTGNAAIPTPSIPPHTPIVTPHSDAGPVPTVGPYRVVVPGKQRHPVPDTGPVPTVGRGAGYARHVQPPTGRRHPTFITPFGHRKAIRFPKPLNTTERHGPDRVS